MVSKINSLGCGVQASQMLVLVNILPNGQERPSPQNHIDLTRVSSKVRRTKNFQDTMTSHSLPRKK